MLCDSYCVGCVYSEEDPEDFILLCPGLDLVKTIVLFLSSKAALHAGCPFFTEFSCCDLSVILMLSCSAFSLEVCDDLLTSTPFLVSIGSIDVIGSDMCNLSEQCTGYLTD